MCGICGYVGDTLRTGLLRTMAGCMCHRGPDDEGYYENDRVGLGHKRLSIIDIKHGHQPMLSEDNRYVLVFNGEIYNYRQLRAQLEARGRKFRTNSDTEVLLYWIIEHGLDRILDLNGMFAFALWDSVDKSLLLVRDRLGIKPLYYSKEKHGLVFGSEIKAMLPAMAKKAPNYKAISEFLTFQNMLGSQSFFDGVERLSPGCWIKWTPSGMTQGRYWDVKFNPDSEMSFNGAVEQYQVAIRESVQRHMIADVPVGSYLSGGIDSSSVATLASQYTTGPIHTFTGAFTDAPYYDERVGSRAVARNIGGIVHEVEINSDNYQRDIGKVIYHLDEPTLGTGALPCYTVAKLVSESVKVVLTGHGGDEMFAGYQVNKVALIRETIKKNPSQLFSVIFGVRPDEWTRVLYYMLFPLLYPEVGYGLYVMTPRSKRASLFTPGLQEQLGGYEPFDALSPYLVKTDSPGERILRLYLQTFLPTLFIQEDKVSMAHSLEARTPICDNAMLDLALRLPLNIKLFKNTLKAVPKAAMRSSLPEILYSLPKRGFPTPFNLWYRQEPLRSFMMELLCGNRTRARGLFNTTRLNAIVRDNDNARINNLYSYARANLMYSYSIVELWFRTYMDQAEPRPVV